MAPLLARGLTGQDAALASMFLPMLPDFIKQLDPVQVRKFGREIVVVVGGLLDESLTPDEYITQLRALLEVYNAAPAPSIIVEEDSTNV